MLLIIQDPDNFTGFCHIRIGQTTIINASIPKHTGILKLKTPVFTFHLNPHIYIGMADNRLDYLL